MCANAAGAVTLDRVVASVNYRAITESDVTTEYRFEQFLGGKKPAAPPDDETLERVRDRLMDQILLSEEAEISSPAADSREKAVQELADIEKQFGSHEAFVSALQSTGLDQAQVIERLREREAILGLIDRRLRPEVWVEQSEIETYYNKTFVPSYQKENKGPAPPLAEVEDRIREMMTQERVNKRLEDWLRDLKTTHRVEVHSF